MGLGKNLFPLFARALDLAPEFFDDKVRILLLIDQRQHGLTWNGPNDDDTTFFRREIRLR